MAPHIDGTRDAVVMFHAKWCPHCTDALPAFADATAGKNGVLVEESQVAGLVGDVARAISGHVRGFPTIMYVHRARRDGVVDVSVFERERRDARTIRAFVDEHRARRCACSKRL